MADVEPLSWEARKRRWKFVGHVLRKGKESICGTSLTWTPEGRRKRGRPKTAWQLTVAKERNRAGWKTWMSVQKITENRVKWHLLVEALCATWHEEDRYQVKSTLAYYRKYKKDHTTVIKI